jgi:hypothetical protein
MELFVLVFYELPESGEGFHCILPGNRWLRGGGFDLNADSARFCAEFGGDFIQSHLRQAEGYVKRLGRE